MAFLCPAKFRKDFKKKFGKAPAPPAPCQTPSTRKITGSVSVDTLYLVDFENGRSRKGSPKPVKIVIDDFEPTADDEMRVNRGDKVMVLHKQEDWYLVMSQDGKEGYVPAAFCVDPNSAKIRENIAIAPDVSYQEELMPPPKPQRARPPVPGSSDRSNLTKRMSSAECTTRSMDNWGLTPIRPSQSTENIKTDQPCCVPVRWRNEPPHHHHQLPPKPTKRRVPGALRNHSNLHKHLMASSSEEISSSRESLYSEKIGKNLFRKKNFGSFVVLFGFRAVQKNDVTVARGDMVTLLNKDDPEWCWIRTPEGNEGFVPAAFIFPASEFYLDGYTTYSTDTGCEGDESFTDSEISFDLPTQKTPPLGRHQLSSTSYNRTSDLGSFSSVEENPAPPPLPTQLMVVEDFTKTAPDDLAVKRGQLLYAFWDKESSDGEWIWAYNQTNHKQGFVPRQFVRPYLVTSL
ncbi:SH3 domain-containing protein Dlish-like [Tubulanus polymorphus]|uniref:SH3 domain-containing protein Dlish-like n=1 Tax=Tubulanus polymorphus TaxID=672921 RepID=UPI003DA5FFFE